MKYYRCLICNSELKYMFSEFYFQNFKCFGCSRYSMKFQTIYETITSIEIYEKLISANFIVKIDLNTSGSLVRFLNFDTSYEVRVGENLIDLPYKKLVIKLQEILLFI